MCIEEDYDARLHDLEYPCASESEAEEGVSDEEEEEASRDGNALLLHHVVRSPPANEQSRDEEESTESTFDESFSDDSRHVSDSSITDSSAAEALAALSSLDENDDAKSLESDSISDELAAPYSWPELSDENGWIALPKKESVRVPKRKAPASQAPGPKKPTPEWRRVPSKMQSVIEDYCSLFFAVDGDTKPLTAWYDEQLARVSEVLGCSIVEFGKMVLAIKAGCLRLPEPPMGIQRDCRFCGNVAVHKIAENSYYFPQPVFVCAKCTMATWVLQELVLQMEEFAYKRSINVARSKISSAVRSENDRDTIKATSKIFMNIACSLL